MRDHLVRQVQRYFHLQTLLEKGSGKNDDGVPQLPKAESRVPYGYNAEDLISDPDNRVSLPAIDRLVVELKRHKMSWRGISITGILCDMEASPGSLRYWEEHSRPHLDAYGKTCELLADALIPIVGAMVRSDAPQYENLVHPKDFRVVLAPMGEQEEPPASSKTEARDQDRRIRKEDSYRKIAARLGEIMDSEECSARAAIGLYRDRLERDNHLDVSPRRCYEALAYTNGEGAA